MSIPSGEKVAGQLQQAQLQMWGSCKDRSPMETRGDQSNGCEEGKPALMATVFQEGIDDDGLMNFQIEG